MPGGPAGQVGLSGFDAGSPGARGIEDRRSRHEFAFEDGLSRAIGENREDGQAGSWAGLARIPARRRRQCSHFHR